MLLLAGSLAGVNGPSSLLVLPSTHGLEGAIWMMTQEEFMNVQTLHAAGWTIRQIAEHVGYHQYRGVDGPSRNSYCLRAASTGATMDKTTIQTATVDRIVQVIAVLAILWALGNIAQSI